MKKGSHQKEIPIEDFEDKPVQKKEKTPFFDEDESIAQKSTKKQNLHQRHRRIHLAKQRDDEVIDNGGHKVMYKRDHQTHRDQRRGGRTL
jgi:hypothetical protein